MYAVVARNFARPGAADFKGHGPGQKLTGTCIIPDIGWRWLQMVFLVSRVVCVRMCNFNFVFFVPLDCEIRASLMRRSTEWNGGHKLITHSSRSEWKRKPSVIIFSKFLHWVRHGIFIYFFLLKEHDNFFTTFLSSRVGNGYNSVKMNSPLSFYSLNDMPTGMKFRNNGNMPCALIYFFRSFLISFFHGKQIQIL